MKERALPFDTSRYDDLPICAFMYEAVPGEGGAAPDYRIVYGNDAYAMEWRRYRGGQPFLGLWLRRDAVLNEESLHILDRFQREAPYSFSSYLQDWDAHVHFQPMRGLPAPYGGFFLSNITEYEEDAARMHFLRSIRQIETAALLMRRNDEGAMEIVYLSHAFADLLGCAFEEALERLRGTGFMDSIHPEDQLMVKRMLRRRTSEEGTRELVFRILSAKGEWIWCRVHYAFIDDFGEHYVYCTYSDITAMKEYERRLRTSYMSLGDSFYQMNARTLGMFRVNLSQDKIEDMQGRDLYGSDSVLRSYTEILRLRAEHYPILREREEFLHNFGKDALIDSYMRGQAQKTQLLYSRRWDGRACFVSFTAAMTRHPLTGEMVAFIAEQEANNEKVGEMLIQKILARQFDMVAFLSEEKYGVVVGDAELIEKGSIFPLERNGAYQSYLETQVFPVLSGSPEEIREMKQGLALETVRERIAQGEPYVANIRIRVDGENYFKRFDFYSVDPEADFYILLKSDTTAIQQEQIQRNEQLRTALEEAKQASVAKTAFLSRMSHEIRTPMNAIIGLDNIALQEPGLSGAMQDHLGKIGDSARYLLSLINDILDMSRIESGKMTLRNEEFSFHDFLNQINTMVDSQCRDRGLAFECVLEGAVGEYYIGDDMKLKQVLINILGNAVKFTPPGGKVSFYVECVGSIKEQAGFRFVIKDTGIGMDKEYLPRIFDAFSQEDASTTSRYGGSGLGLAITKNIVEMMNGSITVESEKGVGTSFTVNVSLRAADDQKHGGWQEVRPGELDVLVIDDDPVACQHAKIVLEEVGIAADTCLSGREALELIRLRHARREAYNLILVDLKMPEQDGVAVTREVRKLLDSDHDTAIIILTAYSWADVEAEAVEAGVDGFMSKPLFASSVLSEFQRAMRGKRQQQEEAAEPDLSELEGCRVLLAEDVPVNAEIMKELLALMGMEADHAENGKLAVEMFSQSPGGYYDAVLMDVRMPVMDGLAATEAIRALPHPDSKSVPIIAMTANAFDEDVQRSLQAGMDAHLSKPVDPDRLFKTMLDLIGRRRHGGAKPVQSWQLGGWQQEKEGIASQFP